MSLKKVVVQGDVLGSVFVSMSLGSIPWVIWTYVEYEVEDGFILAINVMSGRVIFKSSYFLFYDPYFINNLHGRFFNK